VRTWGLRKRIRRIDIDSCYHDTGMWYYLIRIRFGGQDGELTLVAKRAAPQAARGEVQKRYSKLAFRARIDGYTRSDI